TLAARAITAETPEALAAAGLAWLEDAVPGSRVRSVLVCGAGFSATAGEPVPEDLLRVASEAREVVMLRDGGARKIGPLSIAVVPLLAAGAWHGTLVVRSREGQPLPRTVLKPLSVAGPLLALAAASLAVRREGEERRHALERKVREMAAAGEAPPTDPIGSSSVFRRALDLCRAVAPTDVPVLLTGETGTGKEVLARAIHRWSRRAAGPFVAFNCAAIPETLIEAELFGHVRGAFTGATADRAGLFEAANGGTLLLDEIGEMPSHLQVKLLRAIQEGDIRRLGANRSVRVDVRVLSATNRDLPALVEAGRFRSDLMYRLNAVTVRVPPLRERRSDVPLLAHFLLGAACRQLDRRVAGFSPEALAGMWFREYPGNVRELENLVLRAVALTAEGHAIVAEALDGWPPEGDSPKTGATLQEAVEMAERLAVRSALERNEGNLSRASRDLGLTRAGLYKLMVRLGMRERAARTEGADEPEEATGEVGAGKVGAGEVGAGEVGAGEV
ncbi:MAG: sigma-54-dependent Fis family transcriptional regulator, partial [Deltaproteobacteria bacterium]|nr:sigma-54-dependent Fis family transcriptional regulator [Deltaproteobacteria bacterium]